MSLNRILFWFSGTDPDIVKEMKSRDRMLRSGLGLVFLLNYFVLLLAWLKVGLRYFGWMGVLVGLLVPSIFLALDRIIAMRHRHLTGPLAVYNHGQTDDRTEVKLRIIMALALSLATTFTFQMDQANSLISDKAKAQWQTANQTLRTEIAGLVSAEATAQKTALEATAKSLEKDIAVQEKQRNEAIEIARETASKARHARDEQSAENGGLGRVAGQGSKFLAQRDIADRNQALAASANTAAETAQNKLNELNSTLSQVNKDISQLAEKSKNGIAEVDAAIAKDSRFVPMRTGLFSDATIFLGLFFDPAVAAGMWVMSIITWAVLLTLELAALLGLRLLPTSAYDLALITNLRSDSARLIAGSEIELAQLSARAVERIRVFPHPPDVETDDHAPPPRNTNKGVNEDAKK